MRRRTAFLLALLSLCLGLCLQLSLTTAHAQERTGGSGNIREANTRGTYERRFQVMKGIMDGANLQYEKLRSCEVRQLFYHSPSPGYPSGYCINPITGAASNVP